MLLLASLLLALQLIVSRVLLAGGTEPQQHDASKGQSIGSTGDHTAGSREEQRVNPVIGNKIFARSSSFNLNAHARHRKFPDRDRVAASSRAIANTARSQRSKDLPTSNTFTAKDYTWFNVTPSRDHSKIALLKSMRATAVAKHAQKNDLHPCGIMWTLSSINGSTTNYDMLRNVGFGESRYRLLNVIYEVIISASRVRNAFNNDGELPKVCRGAPIQLSLFIDRDITSHFQLDHSLAETFQCLFDRVFYFDDFIDEHRLINDIRRYEHSQIFARLSARSNAMKVMAFLLTPYEYTLYLDGDTAPCYAFQRFIFSTLASHEIMATPNPFGFVSTNGARTYTDCPSHPKFSAFPEINGGIFGFRWTNRTEDLFIRTMELIPSFAKLGFDQDQAMMRQALFESIVLHRLKVTFQPMDRFCRFGWNCEQNDCKRGCVMIHTRLCNDLGVAAGGVINGTQFQTQPHPQGKLGGNATCLGLIKTASELESKYGAHYRFSNRNNKKNRNKIVKNIDKRTADSAS